MNHQQENDELRARFTAWIEITLYRAKINYLKKQDKERKTIYVEALPEELLVEESQERRNRMDLILKRKGWKEHFRV